MATNLLTFNAIGIRACASGNESRTARRSSPPSSAAGSNWWSPIFGWSADPDYIDSSSGKIDANSDDFAAKSEAKPARSKFNPGCFDEEKARRLRMMTTGTETFHDAMYHSAIASRLASDFSRPSDR